MALSEAPTLNGHIVMGSYYPSPTVDIGTWFISYVIMVSMICYMVY
jgi:hypothetical protein